VIGILYSLLVVVIWSAWVFATLFGVTTRLNPCDIAFIRYFGCERGPVADLVPPRFPLRKLGIGCALLMVCGAGLPTGMSFAQASAARSS
jgi:hypothetical protein